MLTAIMLNVRILIAVDLCSLVSVELQVSICMLHWQAGAGQPFKVFTMQNIV